MKALRNGTGEPPRRGLPLVERLLARVSPSWSLRRAKALYELRGMDRALARSFDAADRGRRLGRVGITGNDANVELLGNLATIRNRSRALCRNTPWGRRAIGQWSAWLVGTGWMPTFDEADDEREELWNGWAEDADCDVEGVSNLRALQRTIARCWWESGEVIILRHWAPAKAIPFDIAVYEPDYLDDSRDAANNDGSRVIQGVQYDANHRITGYWLHQQHPGSFAAAGKKSRFYPAEDVIHLYLRDRPGQARGLPLLVAAMLRLNDWDEFADAKVVQQKVAANFVGVEHDLTTEPPMNPEDPNASPAIRYAEPGSILKAPAGKTIDWNDTPDPGPVEQLASVFLHEIAAATDLPYEVLTGHLEKLSYSTARIGYFPFYAVLEDVASAAWVPLWLNRLGKWFGEAAALRGSKAFDKLPIRDWTAPARPTMNPQEEMAATVGNVRGGLETLSNALRARGRNPRRHLERLAADFKLLDELGLKLDIDPRKFGKTASGGGFDIMEKTAENNAGGGGSDDGGDKGGAGDGAAKK